MIGTLAVSIPGSCAGNMIRVTYTRYLSYSPFQISVVGSNNVDFVLHHPVHQTIPHVSPSSRHIESLPNAPVICIHPFVITFEPLPPFISRYPKGYPVLCSQFLQLCHHTVRDDWIAFGVKAVHHGGEHLQLVLYGMGEEIRIDQNTIWGHQGLVVLEEEGRGDLWSVYF